MWRSARLPVFYVLAAVLVLACSKKESKRYTKHPQGYYYELIAFDNSSLPDTSKHFAHLAITFSNQKDSVFWDSYNNFKDNYFIRLDSNVKQQFIQQLVSVSSVLDSLCLLIPTRDFYKQQFNSSKIPYFSQNDTVVKVYLRVKECISASDFYALKNHSSVEEETQIRNYFGSESAFAEAKDSAGFYWVEKPNGALAQKIAYSDELIIAYEGYFLNGRFLEKSPDRFEYTYGVPDQILKGLNYVIQNLKKGENAKIILPSALAFGENGSSNGTVPPYTPLLYNIKLIDVKTNEKN